MFDRAVMAYKVTSQILPEQISGTNSNDDPNAPAIKRNSEDIFRFRGTLLSEVSLIFFFINNAAVPWSVEESNSEI